MKELESMLEKTQQETIENSAKNEGQQETEVYGNNEPMTKYLQKLGYLKDEKKWLTKKAFFEIGQKMLDDVIKAINESGSGFHETKNIGLGDTILDTTKKLEVGDDLKHLNVPNTLLNVIQRKKSKTEPITFPLEIEFDDFEKFETKEEVKVA
ncbi:MAG: hypothetical protein ACREA1_03070, partial [Nitrosotalea sp.]